MTENEPVRAPRTLRRRKPSQAPLPVAIDSAATESKFEENIELFPHGISIASNLGRPVLILKDKAAEEVLPVWMQPLDAAVALAELSQGTVSTHLVAARLMEMTGLKLESCRFSELIGHHQFVELSFRSGTDETRLMRVRAGEAMSFCLKAQAKFFSTKAFMAQCRELDVDLNKLENNIAQGTLPELQAELENSSKKHPYVM